MTRREGWVTRAVRFLDDHFELVVGGVALVVLGYCLGSWGLS